MGKSESAWVVPWPWPDRIRSISFQYSKSSDLRAPWVSEPGTSLEPAGGCGVIVSLWFWSPGSMSVQQVLRHPRQLADRLDVGPRLQRERDALSRGKPQAHEGHRFAVDGDRRAADP